MQKIVETRNSLSNTIKYILAQTFVTPPCIYSGKGLRMIVLVYLIVLLRELLVSTIFAWCIPTLPFIQLNDFYTCIICVSTSSYILCSYICRESTDSLIQYF